MSKYSFDKTTNRKGTNSVKYDLLEKLYGKENLIPMWVADMDFDTPSFIFEAIAKRAQHPILGYTFRDESYNLNIVEWLQKRHQWKIEPTQISFTPGVVPGLLMAMEAVSNIGDEIIVQTPVYFPFFTTIKKNGRIMLNNDLKKVNGNYRMDFDNLKSIITPKTKAIIISNPHNPVGRVWTLQELNELVDICYDNDIKIISDEIHSDIVFAPNKHIPISSVSDKAAEISMVFMAPSKTFNIAGLSTSFVVIENKALFVKYEQRLDALHLWQGNIFGNVATQAAYSAQGTEWLGEMLTYLEENIDYAIGYINDRIPQISVHKPEATYLLWFDMKEYGMSHKELTDFFINDVGIAINQGRIFGSGGDGYVRLNVATSREIVMQALNQLEKAIKSRK
ncbi:MAG: cystathionine beta-lyase [Bacteroidetes bacterium 4572_112]|nr:MAG: cystathionine beta-lyase [Bacteroidetes bacterium 4572_112]